MGNIIVAAPTQAHIKATILGKTAHAGVAPEKGVSAITIASKAISPESSFVSISDHQRGPLALLPWIRTVYHGLPPQDFKFNPKPGGYLAFIGRIDRDKRPEWAIEIAHRAGIPLKIAAKVAAGEGQEYYDRFVGPHVDGKNVEFIGEISETEKIELLSGALGRRISDRLARTLWTGDGRGARLRVLPCWRGPARPVPELLDEGVTGYVSQDIRTLAQRATELEKISRDRLSRSFRTPLHGLAHDGGLHRCLPRAPGSSRREIRETRRW